MGILPETPYAGDDPERNDAILAGMAYRLGFEVGKTDLDQPIPYVPVDQPKTSVTVQAYELGLKAGRSQSASRLIEHGQQEFWRGYAAGIEDSFGAMDATIANDVAGRLAVQVEMRRAAARPLVRQKRGHRSVRPTRLAVVRQVAS